MCKLEIQQKMRRSKSKNDSWMSKPIRLSKAWSIKLWESVHLETETKPRYLLGRKEPCQILRFSTTAAKTHKLICAANCLAIRRVGGTCSKTWASPSSSSSKTYLRCPTLRVTVTPMSVIYRKSNQRLPTIPRETSSSTPSVVWSAAPTLTCIWTTTLWAQTYKLKKPLTITREVSVDS